MLRSHLHAACASTRAAALLQLPAFHIRHHSVGVMTPSLGDAKLTDVDTDAVISGRELWNERPCVVLAFRRPGCVLCREEAIKVWKLRDKLDGMGVSIAALLHERIPDEVEAFHKNFWPGPLYHDADKTFYKALGGGKVVKGNLLAFANPFSAAWKNARRATKSVKDSNLVGDGLTMGGLFIVGTDGGVVFKHVEETFGQHASCEQILKGAEAAVSKKSMPK